MSATLFVGLLPVGCTAMNSMLPPPRRPPVFGSGLLSVRLATNAAGMCIDPAVVDEVHSVEPTTSPNWKPLAATASIWMSSAIGDREDRRIARVAERREAVGEEDHARLARGVETGDREVEALLEAVVDVGRATRRETGDDRVQLRAARAA